MITVRDLSARKLRELVLVMLCVSVFHPAPSGADATDGRWFFGGHGPPCAYPIATLDTQRQRMIVVNCGGTLAIHPGDPTVVETLVTSGMPVLTNGSRSVYDSARDRILVFGGTSINVLPLGDAVPTWSLLTVDGPAPPSRTFHSAIYDPAGDRMIVFGGFGEPSEGLSGRNVSVWSLSLGGTPAWTDLTPAVPPYFGGLYTGLADHTAIYDPVRHQMVVHGGSVQPSVVPDAQSRTFALPLSGPMVWSQIGTGYALANHSAVYDPSDDRMLLFGGLTPYAGYTFNDLARFPFTSGWAGLHPIGPPPSERSHHAAAWFDGPKEMIVYGGSSGSDEIWRWVSPAAVEVGPTAFGAELSVRPTAAIVQGEVLELRCSFPMAGPAQLTVVDVAGRAVRREVVAVEAPGVQLVRLQLGATQNSGIQYVRLSQGARAAGTKFVALR